MKIFTMKNSMTKKKIMQIIRNIKEMLPRIKRIIRIKNLKQKRMKNNKKIMILKKIQILKTLRFLNIRGMEKLEITVNKLKKQRNSLTI